MSTYGDGHEQREADRLERPAYDHSREANRADDYVEPPWEQDDAGVLAEWSKA